MVNRFSGFGGIPGSTDDFERLSRQYWGAWGEMLRNAATSVSPPDPVQIGTRAWQDSIAWWTSQAATRPAHEDVLGRFNRQASDWYAQAQQVAAQFAGTGASAAQVAKAWKEALGGSAVNTFADMLHSMAGRGVQGVEQWSEDIAPLLQAARMEGNSWLNLPTFGFTREHQERAQELAQAQLKAQEASNAFNTLMLKVSDAAFVIFERLLSEREEPGKQISSPRELFDLWVDAAEQAYAEIALSTEYREAYGNLVNTQMQLRSGVQKEVELASAALGMPTRSELDGAHRKIVELERALRRLRDEAGRAAPAAGGGEPVKRAAKKKSARSRSASAGGRSARSTAPVAAKPEAEAKPKPASAKTARTTGKSAAKPAAKSTAKSTSKSAAKPSRSRASGSARRAGAAPTNGFSTMIPVAPMPLASGKDA